MSIRHLTRTFVPGVDMSGMVDLPKEEVEKLRKVLRLNDGDHIAVLPNDGSVWECIFENKQAIPVRQFFPKTEPDVQVTIAQALPKGDKLDEIIRACTEIGVTHFALFRAERSVVQWDEKKRADRLRRLEVIARESCEVSFRTILPTFSFHSNLTAVLQAYPDCIALSEVEGAQVTGTARQKWAIAVGPEGGWAPRELEMIGDRGFSLGPRVLRVDHAASSASAMILLNNPFV